MNKDRRAVQDKAVVYANPSSMDDGIRKRIEALKKRPIKSMVQPKSFKYDPDEPLRLVSTAEKNRSGEST